MNSHESGNEPFPSLLDTSRRSLANLGHFHRPLLLYIFQFSDFFFRDQIRKGKNLCSPTKPFLWPLRGVDNFLPILEIAIESDRDNLVICLFLISIFSMSWIRVVGGG